MSTGLGSADQSSVCLGETDQYSISLSMKRVQRAFCFNTANALTEDVSFAFASSILRMTVVLQFVDGD
jgi:hypothetical protein